MASPCIEKIKEQLRGENSKLSEQELERRAGEIFRNIKEDILKTQQGAENDFNPTNDIPKAQADMLANKERELLRKKKDAVINALREKELDAHLAKPEFKDKPAEGLRTFLEKAEYSIIGRQAASVGRFWNDLRAIAPGIENRFAKGLFDKELIQELANLGKGGTGKIISGNREAYELAKVMKNHFTESMGLINRAGGDIHELDTFYGKNAHNQLAIRQAGVQKLGRIGYMVASKAEKEAASFSVWREFILKHLDHEKTFLGKQTDEREAMLKQAWVNLSTGEHLSEFANLDGATFGGTGRSLSKKSGAHRTLHFTPEGFVEYNKEFGSGNIASNTMTTLMAGAKTARMMEFLGTNPENLFGSKLLKLKQDNPSISQRDALNSWKLKAQFDILTGKASTPVNPTQAKIFQEIRAAIGAPRLAFSSLHSMPDMANAAVGLSHATGDSFGRAMTAVTSELAPGGTKDRNLVESMMGIQALMSELKTRTAPEGGTPGIASKMLAWTMHFNGQNYWDTHIDNGFGRRLSEKLAEAPKKLSQVTKQWGEMKQLLESHNITDTRWELAKDFMVHEKTESGRNMLVPEMAKDIPEEEIIKAMRKEGHATSPANIQKYRDNLDRDFSDFITEQVSFGIPRQGAQQMVWSTLGGARPGTFVGDVARTFFHFKGTALTSATKILPRLWKAGDYKGAGVATAQLLGAASVLAGIGYTLSDWIKGKESRYNTRAWAASPIKTTMDVVGKSGGFGIYGDFLTAQYSRTGQSLGAALGGPTISAANDLLMIKSRAMEGKDVAPDSLKFIENNAPLLNLPGVRTGVDYLIMYHLMESLNPGYLRRMERYTERNQNQKYFYPPSQNAVGQ